MSEYYYVTRYALSEGILKVAGETEGRTLIARIKGFPNIYHGRDWHRTPEAAEERALQMRDMRISSLRAQIEKLERMTKFQVVGIEKLGRMRVEM